MIAREAALSDAEPRLMATLLLSTLALIVFLGAPGGNAPAGLAVIMAYWGLISRKGAFRHPYWVLMAGLVFASLVPVWFSTDNHRILLLIWLVSLALALHDGHSESLRRSAGFLLGLVFALAVAWKLVSSDFLDGSFLSIVLVVDDRFDLVSALLPAAENAARVAARADYYRWLQVVGAGEFEFPDLPRTYALARTFSLVTVATEALVAAAFLMWAAFRVNVKRHALLASFVAMTYPFAQVTGFGCLVLLMGYATTTEGESKARRLYIAVWIWLLASTWLLAELRAG